MNTTDYLDYDAALAQVRAACTAAEPPVPVHLVNAPALLLASSTFDPDHGYRIDERLLADPGHLARFTGRTLRQQAEHAAAFIAREDPTSGRRSHVASIAQSGETVIVNFSTGDRITAEPGPSGTAATVWTVTRVGSSGDGERGRFSWVGHDRWAKTLIEFARTLRRETTMFNVDLWLTNEYPRVQGLQRRPGPERSLAVSTMSVHLGEAVRREPLRQDSHQTDLFVTRLFDTISQAAAEWAARDGIELTVTATDSPLTTVHPALAAVLARTIITRTGRANYADGWTITTH